MSHMRADEQWARSPKHTVGVSESHAKGNFMNSIIYLVGLVVIVIFVAGFFGLR
jgi:hypothetical protein